MEFYTSFNKHFDRIQVRGYKDGERFSREVRYSPYHFLESDRVDTSFKTVKDVPVEIKNFNTPKEARKYIQEHTGEPIYGSTLYDYVYINDTYKNEIKFDPSSIKIGNFDIETDSDDGYGDVAVADKAVISVTMKIFGSNDVYVLGLVDYVPGQVDHGNLNIRYYKCDDENQLLLRFVQLWEKLDFDVVTGWNIDTYDIPYMVRRITARLGEEYAKRLSPWRNITTRQAVMYNKETTFFGFNGISIIDYLETYRKFTFGNEESYKLDFIAKKVLGVGKLDYSQYGSLNELYKQNPSLFIDYNIIDVVRVEEIDRVEKFMGQIFTIAFYAKVNFSDTFTTVRIWDVMIHNYLLEQGIVVPQNLGNKKTEQNVGGYVKDPMPKRYGYTASFDFASLYPNMTIMYNISPETLVGQVGKLTENKHYTIDQILDGFVTEEMTAKLVAKNLCMSGKGTIFSRNKQGFIPALMAKLFKMRKVFKKQMLEAEKLMSAATKGTPEYLDASAKYTEFNNKQMAIKILLNSGYGALANEYFRWYSNDLAESITMSGQLSTRWAERALNKYLNDLCGTVEYDFVIACDTDSAYVDLDKVVKQLAGGLTRAEVITFLDKFCNEEIGKMINLEFDKLSAMLNAFEKTLDMKREVIASDAIWTGKKHYCMKIWNKEGVAYPEGKLKLTGLEAVKSSTPTFVRSLMKEMIPLILDNKEPEVLKFFDEAYDEYKKLPFNQMAKPSSVSEFLKYADPQSIVRQASGAPPQSKGALTYNHLLRMLKLEKKYQLLKEGEKIRWCKLVQPNPYGIEVIGSADELPPEFNLDKYLDYDAAFESSFRKPMRDLAIAGGMSLSTDFDIFALMV